MNILPDLKLFKPAINWFFSTPIAWVFTAIFHFVMGIAVKYIYLSELLSTKLIMFPALFIIYIGWWLSHIRNYEIYLNKNK